MRAGVRMVRISLVAAVLAVVVGLLVAPAGAQPAPEPPPVRSGANVPLLLILDSSGSMQSDDGTGRPKIEAAKEALLRLVDELPDGAPVGLRVYGHRYPNTDRARGCTDTELLQPVTPLDRDALRQAIGSFSPSGFTPIGASLEAALGDLPAEGPRQVVLVSDGIDTCAPPSPCTVAERLAAENVDLRVETVGFQVDAAAAADLACIADVTGGQFRSVDDSAGLLRALREYQVVGIPVSGGASAEEAPVLESGQYRDSLEVGQQRWYAVELAEGEVLRVTATVVGERDVAVAPEAAVVAELFTDDVLGRVSCGREEELRLGQEARQVGIDGLDTTAAGICSEPGRYALRLELADPAGQGSALAGRPFEAELLISIVQSADQAAAVPSFDVLDRDDELAAAPARPNGGAYVTAGVGAGLLGALIGAFLAWRAGP